MLKTNLSPYTFGQSIIYSQLWRSFTARGFLCVDPTKGIKLKINICIKLTNMKLLVTDENMGLCLYIATFVDVDKI